MVLFLVAAPALAVPDWYDDDPTGATPERSLADELTASYFAAGGDANADGVVDLTDFTILKVNFGRTDLLAWTGGDLTGDGAVDLSDFLVIKANFGTVIAPPDDVVVIPEPLTVATAVLGLAALGLYTRRRQRVA